MIVLVKRSFGVIVNPFSILGLKDSATLDEAKTAYKSLVLKYHPDINKSPETTEKFREIAEAYGLVKKRIESRESIGIPKDESFTSKRPKYNGAMGSTVRDDKIREYINFRPIDIQIPDKDRLGILYKPFFNDQDAVHPKSGTIGIIVMCLFIAMTYSVYFIDLTKKDELINQILYEKLIKKYGEGEWDPNEIHPSLKVIQMDPDYERYLEFKKIQEATSKYKSFNLAPALMDRFNASQYEATEKQREYSKLKE